MTVVVVLPAFNEVGTVEEVVGRVEVLGRAVVVDDGSSDGTGDAAQRAGAYVVRHAVNQGYDGALASGFRAALGLGATVIVTVDADGEHVLDDLAIALAAIERGDATVALGLRPIKARPSERAFGAYTSWRYGVGDILCGVKAYSAAFVAAHLRELDKTSIGTGLAMAALRERAAFVTFPVPVTPRRNSRFGSGLRPNLLIARAFAWAIAADLRAVLHGPR